MNEIFGEENFVGVFVWQSKKGGGSDTGSVVFDHEYILCFGKTDSAKALSRIIVDAEALDKVDDKGPYRRGRELNKWGSNSRRQDRPTMWFPIPGPQNLQVYPIRNDGTEGRWRWGKRKMMNIVHRGDVEFVKRPDGTYIAYEKVRSTDPRTKPYRTWLLKVGTTADGSKCVKELFHGLSIYDFPKPVELVRALIEMGTVGDSDLVLDFFAGSCTTAQAVLASNLEDEGDHRFIMVQLPELTPESSVARNAGYERLSDIGKERVRRVINSMQEGQKTTLQNGDLGFRVFKLAESNFLSWSGIKQSDPAEYLTQLDLFRDPIKKQWTEERIITEVAIKEGFGLNFRTERIKNIQSNSVFKVSDLDKDQSFLICLDKSIDMDALKPLNLSEKDTLFVRDLALTDETAANLALQCRLKTI